MTYCEILETLGGGGGYGYDKEFDSPPGSFDYDENIVILYIMHKKTLEIP